MNRWPAILLLASSACISVPADRARTYPRTQEVRTSDVPFRGSQVALVRNAGGTVQGELIAVDGTTLRVLRGLGDLVAIDWSDVERIEILDAVRRKAKRPEYRVRVTRLEDLSAYARFPQGTAHFDAEVVIHPADPTAREAVPADPPSIPAADASCVAECQSLDPQLQLECLKSCREPKEPPSPPEPQSWPYGDE